MSRRIQCWHKTLPMAAFFLGLTFKSVLAADIPRADLPKPLETGKATVTAVTPATTTPVVSGVDTTASAAPAKSETETPPPRTISDKVRDPKLRSHLLENIEIFGKNDLPAIYILGPGIEDFEGYLLTRDFSRDPFFMQNIDREEFEMKTQLHDFDEKKDDDEKKIK